MIALLFALFAIAMGLAYFYYLKTSFVVFGVTLLLSSYWLKFHATTQLTIEL